MYAKHRNICQKVNDKYSNSVTTNKKHISNTKQINFTETLYVYNDIIFGKK